MVQATIGSCPLNGIGRTRFFHNENPRLIPLWIEAKLTEFSFGDIPALSAK
jgi:hypothetical protein